MTPTLSTRLVPSDRMTYLLAVGGAYAACAAALLVFSLLWTGEHVWPVEPVSGTVALVLAVVAGAHLQDVVRPAVQFWSVRRALANPRSYAMLATQARNAALDHLQTLDVDGLQGKQVSVEAEWLCRRDDVCPLIARVAVVGVDGDQTSRQSFLDNPGNYQLTWAALGVRGTGLKPFTLHTTFGPVPVGTAHAQMERARMRMAFLS